MSEHDQDHYLSTEERLTSLETRLSETQAALKRVEAALFFRPRSAPPPDIPLPAAPRWSLRPEPQTTFEPAVSRAYAPRRTASPSPQRRDGAEIAWEEVIGKRWALWLGAALIFVTMVLVLVTSWRLLGPAGRLGSVAVAGLALMGASEFSRGRTARGFPEGLAGSGLALLYLDAWAALEHFHLLGFHVGLALMLGVAAFGVFLAMRHNAMILSVLSALGGFITPALVDGGGSPSFAPFLSYIAVLNASVLALAVVKRWRPLAWLCFGATVVMVGGWSTDTPILTRPWLVFGFFAVYGVLFVTAAVFRAFVRRETLHYADAALVAAASATFTATGAMIITSLLAHPGLFPLALAAVFGMLFLLARRRAPADRLLANVMLALGAGHLILAGPVQLRQTVIPIVWSLEAAVFLTLAARFSSVVMRRAGQIVWILALFAVLPSFSVSHTSPAPVFLSEPSLSTLAFVATGWWIVSSRWTRAAKDEISALYAVAAVVGGSLWIGRETLQLLSRLPMNDPGNGPLLATLPVCAYAAAAYAVGLRVRNSGVRAFALATPGAVVAWPIWLAAMGSRVAYLPVLNPRAAVYAAVVAAFGACGALAAHDAAASGRYEDRIARWAAWAVAIPAVAGEAAQTWTWTAHRSQEGSTVCALFAALVALAAISEAAIWFGWRREWIEWRWTGYGYLALGLYLIALAAEASWLLEMRPVVNIRAAAFAALTAALTGAWAMLRGRETDEREAAMETPLGVIALVLAFWILHQETWNCFYHFRDALGPEWRRWLQAGLTLAWTLFGAGLLAGGMIWRRQIIRWAAFGVFGATLLKVMMVDLSMLDASARAASTAVLGLAFLGISWFYNRKAADDGVTRPAE